MSARRIVLAVVIALAAVAAMPAAEAVTVGACYWFVCAGTPVVGPPLLGCATFVFPPGIYAYWC